MLAAVLCVLVVVIAVSAYLFNSLFARIRLAERLINQLYSDRDDDVNAICDSIDSIRESIRDLQEAGK